MPGKTLFDQVKNGDLVIDDRTGEEYHVVGKMARVRIILHPRTQQVSGKTLNVSKSEFNQHFYYHRDNLLRFSTAKITKRLQCL